MSQGRTERLLALLLALTGASRPLTRQAIRAAVGEYQGGSDVAFERKFERDKDELRRLGIPIKLVNDSWGEAVGYQLERAELFLPELNFDPLERLVLSLAARAWGEGALSGLRKLETASGSGVRDVETLRVESTLDSGALAIVMTAIGDRQAIGFDYRGAGDAAPKPRRVQPWGAAAERGHWYVVGWDQDRQAQRTYRMSRVTGAIEPYGPRRSFDIPTNLQLAAVVKSDWNNEPTTSATIRLSRGCGHSIRLLGTTNEADAGHDVVEVEDVQPRRIIREVLACGTTAVVLAPPALAQQVTARLETLIDTADASAELDAGELESLAAAPPIVSAKSAAGAQPVNQLTRLLALVPWLEANPGVRMTTAADRFGIPVEQLHEDLNLAVCTEFGAFHSTLDIEIYGRTVTVRDSHGMNRPLRLSSHEAAALLLGLAIIRNALAGREAAAIDRVESKLRAAAASLDESVVRVAVGSRPAAQACEVPVAQAIAESRALHLKYWSAATDTVTERTVDPIAVTWSDGRGYLDAWCRSRGQRRTFRLDRVIEATVLDAPAERADHDRARSAVSPSGPAATLLVEPEARWFVETVPHHRAIDLPGGRMAVSLPIASTPWAIRTIMAMAGAVRVIEPAALAAVVVAEARAALAQY